MFPYISLFKTCDPHDRPNFLPQGHNLNKLDCGILGDARYLISRLKSLWFQTRRIYHVFPYVKNSEYDQEVPQSQTAHKPMALRGRATQKS